MSEVKPQKYKVKNPFALRIFKMHSVAVKLGPKLGGKIIKLLASLCFYKIATNGGVQSLSYVCYQHILQEGVAEYQKIHGTQSRVRENKRP
jgi:hypothetical protein